MTAKRSDHDFPLPSHFACLPGLTRGSLDLTMFLVSNSRDGSSCAPLGALLRELGGGVSEFGLDLPSCFPYNVSDVTHIVCSREFPQFWENSVVYEGNLPEKWDTRILPVTL